MSEFMIMVLETQMKLVSPKQMKLVSPTQMNVIGTDKNGISQTHNNRHARFGTHDCTLSFYCLPTETNESPCAACFRSSASSLLLCVVVGYGLAPLPE